VPERPVVLPPGRGREHMATRKISLKVMTAPLTGHVVSAPPVFKASDHSVDYTCGHCGTILMHAEENQVYGLLLRCMDCGSYNSTEK
jgi:predicted RNA-binding Zn-ribbon protein involved in translation (DUF1610 family)